MDSAYADMIGLPHHVSDHRLPMSRLDRAAQFAPFAALTGFGDVIGECARLTEGEIALSEEELKRERKMQKAVLGIKNKFGPNAILKGTNLQKEATARERNQTIGGHKK